MAAGILAGTFAAWWWSSPSQPAPPFVASAPQGVAVRVPFTPGPPVRANARADADPQPSAASLALAAAAPPRIRRTRETGDDPTPDLADYLNEGERPSMGEVISRLHQAGIYSGLGAFDPPGTRPPLVGLAVPEDFELPEGYVRHHQVTDDGQRIEAILMFSPDRPVFDAQGRAIEVPKDRVVPPELAPPGLPLRRIAIPAPMAPDSPGR